MLSFFFFLNEILQDYLQKFLVSVFVYLIPVVKSKLTINQNTKMSSEKLDVTTEYL